MIKVVEAVCLRSIFGFKKGCFYIFNEIPNARFGWVLKPWYEGENEEGESVYLSWDDYHDCFQQIRTLRKRKEKEYWRERWAD